MESEDINWHDAILLEVLEDTGKDMLTFVVDYPVDWNAQRWEKRSIRFMDVLNYEVREAAFHGPPTILGASVIGRENGRKIIRVETNSGYRQLAFMKIGLEE